MNIFGLLGIAGGKVEETALPPERTTNMVTAKLYVGRYRLETVENAPIRDVDDAEECLVYLRQRMKQMGWYGERPRIVVTPNEGTIRDRQPREHAP